MALKSPGILTFMISGDSDRPRPRDVFLLGEHSLHHWPGILGPPRRPDRSRLRLHNARPLDCAAIAKSRYFRGANGAPAAGLPPASACNVRFCRATLGTLESRPSPEPNARMIMRIFQSDILRGALRRSAREIILAVVLTLAALAFVIAAVSGSTPETAAVIDAGTKPTSKPN